MALSFRDVTSIYRKRPNHRLFDHIMSSEGRGSICVGITCSSFDLLHAGHILMLQEAAAVCDYLICALQVDPSVDRPEKRKPIQTVAERRLQLLAVEFVDEVLTYSTEDHLELVFKDLDLDIRIIGEEYKGKDFTGKEICESRGIKIHYNNRRHRYSTTELIERIQSGR